MIEVTTPSACHLIGLLQSNSMIRKRVKPSKTESEPVSLYYNPASGSCLELKWIPKSLLT